MRYKMSWFVALVLGWLVVCGCVTTLRTYEPQSDAEGKIKSVLLAYEDAWNRQDPSGVLALWHPDAEIMYGSERRVVSKTKYEDILPKRMNDHPTIAFGSPDIAVMDDKAVVKLKMDTGRFKTPITFHVVKEYGEWRLMSWRY